MNGYPTVNGGVTIVILVIKCDFTKLPKSQELGKSLF